MKVYSSIKFIPFPKIRFAKGIFLKGLNIPPDVQYISINLKLFLARHLSKNCFENKF